MARIGCVLLALVLALPLMVCADELTYYTLTESSKAYSSSVKAVTVPVEENPVIDGISPTTGEVWSGTYAPAMTTIDLDPAAYPHWGLASADMVFEMPIHKDGSTRGLALYMSEIPDGSGPVRSARVGMASLREIWNCPLGYYGMREGKATSVKDWWRKYHPELKNGSVFKFPLLDGMAMRNAANFPRNNDGHRNPHNVRASVRGIIDSGTVNSKPRPYLFSEAGMTSGAVIKSIAIPYKEGGKAPFYPSYTFDDSSGLYYRFNNSEPHMDADTGRQLTYSNVILLRTSITWKGNAGAVIPLVGTGTADIFINGYYQRGTWVRAGNKKATDENSNDARLVFYDAAGNELVLKNGKTFVSIMDNTQAVIIANDATQGDSITNDGLKAAPTPKATKEPESTRTPRPTRTPKPDAGTTTDTTIEEPVTGDVSFGG